MAKKKRNKRSRSSSASPAPEPTPPVEPMEDVSPPIEDPVAAEPFAEEPEDASDRPDPRDQFPIADFDIDRLDSVGLRNQDNFDPGKMAAENEHAKRLAGVAAELARKRTEALVPVTPTGDDPNFVYFIKCPIKACNGPGIFIHTLPSGELKPKNWESSYKPRNADWPGFKIYCQCCRERDGINVVLPIMHSGDMPHINPRHVGRMKREVFNKATQLVEVSA